MKETVLITGASRGLGYLLANKFEEEGYSVFRHMGKTHYDLNDFNHISKLASEAKALGVRLLINNDDEQAFKRIINFPARGIGLTTINKISIEAKNKSVSDYTYLKDYSK